MPVLVILILVIRACFGFRASDFGFSDNTVYRKYTPAPHRIRKAGLRGGSPALKVS
jgi:hypothetical protein